MSDDYRAAFDLPADITYLNCAYLAPQLSRVREAADDALALRTTPWEVTPESFFTEAERGRRLFAELVGGDADGVALIPSASYGIGTAARNVEVRRGDRIIVLQDQFPSNYYPWLELTREHDAELHVVAKPRDEDWTTAILGAITPDTAVVAVPNCHWTDGALVDLVRIGERTREVDSALVVDATQSLGAMPFDVAEIQPDYLVASGYKWLLGPYGNGFMYVAERHRNGVPIEGNWLNRAGSEDFSRLTEYTDGFQPGARRFDAGGRGANLLLPLGSAALEWILAEGVANIADGISHITSQIAEMGRERSYGVTPEHLRAKHMLGLRLGDDIPPNLTQRLASRNVHVSVRGPSVRVSPHLYNDEGDVEQLFSALEDVL